MRLENKFQFYFNLKDWVSNLSSSRCPKASDGDISPIHPCSILFFSVNPLAPDFAKMSATLFASLFT